MRDRVPVVTRSASPSPYRLLISFLFATCVGCTRAAVAGSPIRGLDPKLAPRYTRDSGQFSCLDGGSTLSFDRVNDDFCDCVDGSDEPGTSACPTGHFYCRNRGHQPLRLNSSSVDDRICDCCDGSDERPGLCKDTCAQAGAANREALKLRATAFKQGLKSRQRYAKDAAATRRKWEAEIVTLQKEATELKKTVARLQGKKERIERLEAKEREREAAARAKREAEEAAKRPAEAATPQQDVTPGDTGEASPDLGTSEESAEEASGQAAEGQEPVEEEVGDEEEEELSEDEKGRRIAAQWTHDPEAVGADQNTAASQDGGEDVTVPPVPKYEPPDLGNQETVTEETKPEEEEEAKAVPPPGLIRTAQQWLYGKLGWELGSQANTAAHRQKVKDEFHAENSRLNDATRRAEELEGKLGMEAGPNDEFLALVDRCFTANVEKYVYEVCPFKFAAQKDGGMQTGLGNWEGFSNNYSTLVFKGGQHCWNGPNRSLQVDLECGPKEEVFAVEEPSRCEYRAKMTTPLACSHAEAEAINRQLAAAEAELTGKDEL